MISLGLSYPIRRLSTQHCYNCIYWDGHCTSAEVAEAKRRLYWLKNWAPRASDNSCEEHEWEEWSNNGRA